MIKNLLRSPFLKCISFIYIFPSSFTAVKGMKQKHLERLTTKMEKKKLKANTRKLRLKRYRTTTVLNDLTWLLLDSNQSESLSSFINARPVIFEKSQKYRISRICFHARKILSSCLRKFSYRLLPRSDASNNRQLLWKGRARLSWNWKIIWESKIKRKFQFWEMFFENIDTMFLVACLITVCSQQRRICWTINLTNFRLDVRKTRVLIKKIFRFINCKQKKLECIIEPCDARAKDPLPQTLVEHEEENVLWISRNKLFDSASRRRWTMKLSAASTIKSFVWRQDPWRAWQFPPFVAFH